MNEVQLRELATEICWKYQVNHTWIHAIISQESHWDPFAIRYEPSYSYLYSPEKYKMNSLSTEIQMQKTSWGLGQIMGAVAREQGFASYLSQLVIPDLNLNHICMTIVKLRKISPSWDDICAMYNGGPGAIKKDSFGKYKNQAYVDSVKKFL